MRASNLRRAALAALLLASGAAACADSFKHFRHLLFRESPMEPLRGRHEISAEQAKTTLHHRFRYDNQGRLIEVNRAMGDQPTSNVGSFAGFFWWAPQLRIEYAPGKEIRSFHNEAGERMAAHGAVWRMEFALDAQGRHTSLHYFDKDGQPVEGAWGVHRYAWDYPEPGVVIETRHKLNGEPAAMRPDFPFQRVRLEFGSDDLLDAVLNIDAQGQLVAAPGGAAVDRLYYDPWLNMVRWQVFDAEQRPKNGNGPNVALGEYVFDGLGQTRVLRAFGERGEPRGYSSVPGWLDYVYDRHGNLQTLTAYNLKGEVELVSRLSYSPDGSRLAWTRYFDAQGRPTVPRGLPPEADGMVAQQAQYDARGVRIAPIRYGADGKPLPAPPRVG